MPRRIFVGQVTSIVGNKTVMVKVRKHRKDPKYKKQIAYDVKYMAHSEELIALGTVVEIEESRPISKRKAWVVIKQQLKEA
jgi:small subunit ribosomal protein S17